jgi:hypothetical protein
MRICHDDRLPQGKMAFISIALPDGGGSSV